MSAPPEVVLVTLDPKDHSWLTCQFADGSSFGLPEATAIEQLYHAAGIVVPAKRTIECGESFADRRHLAPLFAPEAPIDNPMSDPDGALRFADGSAIRPDGTLAPFAAGTNVYPSQARRWLLAQQPVK